MKPGRDFRGRWNGTYVRDGRNHCLPAIVRRRRAEAAIKLYKEQCRQKLMQYLTLRAKEI